MRGNGWFHARAGRAWPLGLLLALAMQPAAAQSTRDRLTALEQGVARLERMLENNQAIQTDMLGRIQQLQAENQALRNSVDELQFESSQSGDRQRQLYLDLDQRLQALEGGGVATGSGGISGGAAPSGAAGQSLTDAEAYQSAFDLLKQGNYAEAQTAFRDFLATYPGSDLRGNAQYWLAETYYVTKDFEQALGLFETVIADYPTSRKIPDAWLKVGYCNYELQRWSDAKLALSTVAARYNDSTAAKLAEQRLEQMRREGR